MQIHSKSILLDDGQSINLGLRVIDALKVNDFIVVLTEPNEKEKWNNENVFGYNLSGELKWQIEDLNLFHENHDYTAIYIQDRDLYLYNRCGVEVKVDPATGTALSTELIK